MKFLPKGNTKGSGLSWLTIYLTCLTSLVSSSLYIRDASCWIQPYPWVLHSYQSQRHRFIAIG